jgi:dTDP-4-amino-4,6-dideoxygalactose transaminase
MYRIGKDEIDAVARVIESRELFKVNGGKLQETANFEAEFKQKMQCDYAILMTSGKAALISSLVGLGIGPGDEVIVPGYTYMATAVAVTAVGAIPVIAEVDETLTLDPASVEANVSPNTKAIIPVHIQGFPCNMDALVKLAEKHGFAIVEDACQADGGSYKGRRLGTIGDAGAFSFNHFKIITSGEGGALVTNQRELFERAFIYHDSSAIAYFGNQLDNVSVEPFCGNEFRTSEITAAILRQQLLKLDSILEDLRANKKAMMDALDTFTFRPSHDPEGDCGTTVAFAFETEEEARKFAKAPGIHGVLPIDTGKHIYTHWTPIMEKRGAHHPLLDPFKMPANADLNHNYRLDMCPKTLSLLATTVYVNINPDWSEEALSAKIDACRAAR